MADDTYTNIASEIGLDRLRAAHPELTGTGVTVGQAEAYDAGPGTFEVNPAAIGWPADNSDRRFTFYSGARRTYEYDDGVVGSASSHATAVAQLFYGAALYKGEPVGVVPGVAHVDNYDASTYAPGKSDKVVNLSFSDTDNVDAVYDRAALANNTVFVASAGNSGKPSSPSTAYNVISVGASDAAATTATGPAADGAAKPDISAPGNATSSSAPLVSGAATLLVQAGKAGYGGTAAGTRTKAVDFRTIKALLLNGAVKPSDYFTNAYAPSSTSPLNGRYGSGVVNVYNSVQELSGGKVAPRFTGSAAIGVPSFVAHRAAPTAAARGWDLVKVKAPLGRDATTDTLVSLKAGFTFVSTLTWASNASNAINHFSLTLFDETTGAVVARSDAMSSNVQQVYFAATHAGTYDIRVELAGSSTAAVSDTYALAYDTAAYEETVACFAAGTLIRTVRGNIPVEHLRIGDLAVTAAGASRPITWLGSRTLDCRRHPQPADVMPVRIAAHAFGDARPTRPLFLSPGHPVLIGDDEDEVLVPIMCLVNGTTIERVPVDEVTYWHVELDQHDILLAEGLPAESYFDLGSRPWFAGAESALYDTDMALPGMAGRCRPVAVDGPVVEAERRRLDQVFATRLTGACAWPASEADAIAF